MPRGVDCPQSLTPIVTVTTVPFSYPTAVPSEGTVVSPPKPVLTTLQCFCRAIWSGYVWTIPDAK